MARFISGVLALIGLFAAFLHFRSEPLFDYCLFTAFVIVLIWFPDAVNTYTVGMWIDGYKIENPTPRIMISGFGWIALIVVNGYVFGLF